MMKADPMLAVVSRPWRLRVWFEPGSVPVYLVEVSHIRAPDLRHHDTVPCFHEPLFGIDTEDMVAIRAAAEDMTKDLEKELGEERWASLRSPVS